MAVYGRESWIGRLDYAYKDKYMAEIIFRRDGSLKFPSSDRWGNFPGVLLGWRASEEKFWQEQLPFINYFKLRTSYGKIGMDPGDPFQYINKYSLGTGMTIGENKDVITKIYQDGVANTHITWEKQQTWNLGFDAQFNKGMFRLNADFFRNKRSDILTPRNASVPDRRTSSLEQAREWYRHERLIEMLAEGDRWYCIRKWMICEEVIRDDYPMYIYHFNDGVNLFIYNKTTIADARKWVDRPDEWRRTPVKRSRTSRPFRQRNTCSRKT